MKIYAIKSTEYEANTPDTFLMDDNGNYYGAFRRSYVENRNFPKSIDYWRTAICSDDDRYFRIWEADVDRELVEKFEALTRQYEVAIDSAKCYTEYSKIFAERSQLFNLIKG